MLAFISPTAEFTPKTVETPELVTQLIYRMRLKVEGSAPGLRQGMAVTVYPATGEVTDAPKPKKKAAKKAVAPKQRTASIFKSMDLATVDLETALRLLDLPRVVGQDPESGEDITAQNGKFGPYLKKGADTRSLTEEDQIFEIDLAGALELY